MSGNKCFRRLDKRIKELKDDNSYLHSQIDDAEYSHQEDIRSAESQAYYARVESEKRVREAQRKADEARREADNRRYDIERATKDVERARDWGNLGEVDSAIRKLKRLSYTPEQGGASFAR
jgi:hypothetical protein